MRDRITIYGLLGKIYNENTDMPKKIMFCGYEYEWNNDFQDYLRNIDENGLRVTFMENHNDNLLNFLQDTVEIVKEDNKEFTGTKGYYKGKEVWSFNYSNEEDKYKTSLKSLKDTIEQLLEEDK